MQNGENRAALQPRIVNGLLRGSVGRAAVLHAPLWRMLVLQASLAIARSLVCQAMRHQLLVHILSHTPFCSHNQVPMRFSRQSIAQVRAEASRWTRVFSTPAAIPPVVVVVALSSSDKVRKRKPQIPLCYRFGIFIVIRLSLRLERSGKETVFQGLRQQAQVLKDSKLKGKSKGKLSINPLSRKRTKSQVTVSLFLPSCDVCLGDQHLNPIL